MYVYIKTETQNWTVGFYAPNGQWHAESDHATPAAAAEQVHYLNGGEVPENPYILHGAALDKATKERG